MTEFPPFRRLARLASSLIVATMILVTVAAPAGAQTLDVCDVTAHGSSGLGVAAARESFAALVEREPVAGAAIAVVVDGELAWDAECGLADVASQRRVRSDTRFRTGSVSKVLTALALLRLYDAGAIDLDVDARTLVPAIAGQTAPITVRQLAGHLGGIRHYRSAEEYLNTRRYEQVSDAFGVFATDSLVAPPGTTYAYSSYGYNLLGAVIEAAAEREYVAAVQHLVLGPLGLTATTAEASVPGDALATPYSFRDDSLRISPPFDPSDRVPSGGWAATASDLARAGYALIDPAWLSADARALVAESQRTADGQPTEYSIGVRVGVDEAGRRILHHGGTSVGARAFLLVYPDHGISVAVLANGPAVFAEAEVAQLAEPFLDVRPGP